VHIHITSPKRGQVTPPQKGKPLTRPKNQHHTKDSNTELHNTNLNI